MTYGLDPQDGTGEGYDGPHAVRGGIRWPGSEPAPKYDGRDELTARRDRLEREAARLSERITMLDNLPEEPVFEDGEPSVVWFNRKFSRRATKYYTYAATRTDDGKWYTTGPRTPKAYTWAELIQWVREFEETEVWIATAYEAL